ncbi:MAG: aspartate aminotransferase family protein [Myxococcales bacterium]|nr:aspartate aminotransferase family protein [Myxococcales bacterium]
MSANQPTRQALLDDYARFVSPAQVARLRALGHDFIESRREGPDVYDQDGRQYLDCYSSAGIYNLGRRQPELLAELRQAMRETDQGNFPMISREKARLAAALAAFVPGALECTMFSVVRGEAFDFACKLARGYTRRPELIAPEGSWFGQTGFAVSLSTRADKRDFAPLVPETKIIPFGDAAAARAAIGPRTAAVFLEPRQTENHCRPASADYLRALRRLCTETGVLLVLDETQTGLGRTGKRFAFEHAGIEPDVLIIGEALGAGVFPIAATLFTPAINKFMNAHPLIHLSTFGGSDLGCRIGARALEIYAAVAPWENAAALGRSLQEKLQTIAARHSRLIESIAGDGLLYSLAFAGPAEAEAFCRRLAAHGVLAVPGKVATNTVVLRPNLTIGQAEADRLLQAVEKAAAGV